MSDTLPSNLSQLKADIEIWGRYHRRRWFFLEFWGRHDAARLHRDLCQRYAAIIAKAAKSGDDADFRAFLGQFLDVQQQEPPPYHAVFALAQNEYVTAKQLPESSLVRIPLWRRLAANVFRMADMRWRFEGHCEG